MARIDSRGGQAPERLCGLVAESEPTPGAVLSAGGTEVGRVTSAAWSPRRNAWVGLRVT